MLKENQLKASHSFPFVRKGKTLNYINDRPVPQQTNKQTNKLRGP
jgi:hypothetical protein